MKKAIRIILSPIVFLFMVCALTVLPLGPLCLMMGLGQKAYCWVTDKSHTSDNPEWWFVFVWVVGPWYEANKFIRGEPLS